MDEVCDGGGATEDLGLAAAFLLISSTRSCTRIKCFTFSSRIALSSSRICNSSLVSFGFCLSNESIL